MPEPRHLRNAPIREAIIDLRVKARADLRATDLSAARDRIRAKYPKTEELRGFGAELQVGPKLRQATTTDLGLQGYLFKSEDGRNIAQFRTDGFAFNRLRPYTTWEDVFPAAMGAWGLYRELARPEVVTRLAVRYINNIPIPPTVEDLDEFLRAAPVIPPELPQYLNAFVSRMTLLEPKKGLAANVVQALEPRGPAAEGLTVLLDIDAYKASQIEPDDPAIKETLDDLHAYEKKIFFNSLTEEALWQFQ